MSDPLHVALIGGGDAVAWLAQTLTTAGHHVVVADPAPRRTAPVAPRWGVAAPAAGPATPGPTPAQAVAGAAVVLTLNPPIAALKLARELAPLLAPGAVYADFNPGSPAAKQRLAALFPDHAFADGALTEHPSPSVAVAGPGAAAVVALLGSAGIAVELVSAVPGDVAAREILRSMLEKSLAAAVIDTLWAAEALGQRDWAYEQVRSTFDASTAATAAGYLGGTAEHLKRRQMEMMDVVETMREAGYDSTLVAAIETNYSRILHGTRVPFSKGQ